MVGKNHLGVGKTISSAHQFLPIIKKSFIFISIYQLNDHY